jgi:hypothetical protein
MNNKRKKIKKVGSFQKAVIKYQAEHNHDSGIKRQIHNCEVYLLLNLATQVAISKCVFIMTMEENNNLVLGEIGKQHYNIKL